MTHSTSTSRVFRPAEPREARASDETEHHERIPEQRPVSRSEVGWRYGSALAAARALNARPARA